MSESTLPVTSRPRRPGESPIVVEISMKPLPARMRLGGLRNSVGMPSTSFVSLRRILMIPVAMMTRLLSR